MPSKRRSMFTPVQRVRGSRQVVEQIKTLIDEGVLKPGEQLPAERELAARFGVSRATLREAVQSLSSLGLLEVRQGIGTSVSPHATTLEDPAYWLPWLSSHREDVRALLEVREALESKSAALAAEAVAAGRGGTGAAIKALEKNIAEMEESAAVADVTSLVRLDLEFHSLLSQMGGNVYLLRLARSINHVFADRRAVMAIPGRGDRSLAEHRGILVAVGSGHPAAAAAAMVAHLTSTKAAVDSMEHQAPAGR